MERSKLLTLITIIVVFIATILGVAYKVSSDKMVLLYSNLEIKDSGEVVSELEKQNIKYELRAHGTQILIPEEQVFKVRMSMAQQGLPNTGSIVGYEIFDNGEVLGTSNFVQNVNLIRALEGELARSISSFKHISSARVHLVIPKRELFTRDRKEPSASIVLDTQSASLSKDDVNAISH